MIYYKNFYYSLRTKLPETRAASRNWINMIGCYVTGILPRPEELIAATRLYTRGHIDRRALENAFIDATIKIIETQSAFGFTYLTDGMLRWQDLLRPFINGLNGVEMGSLSRWFNNNIFYRKPIIVRNMRRKKNIIEKAPHIKGLSKKRSWKAILPAPYTFTQLSEDRVYRDQTEFMLAYAKILREEVESLSKRGCEYVQLSDPALVYNLAATPIRKDHLESVKEALKVAIGGLPIRTSLQTFFGDFLRISPEALDFPVDDLGIDLYETDLKQLEEYSFEKGIALGLVDSRNSLVEKPDELVEVTRKIIGSIYSSKIGEVFICPNCDFEHLPWKRTEQKMRSISVATDRLRDEFS